MNIKVAAFTVSEKSINKHMEFQLFCIITFSAKFKLCLTRQNVFRKKVVVECFDRKQNCRERLPFILSYKFLLFPSSSCLV